MKAGAAKAIARAIPRTIIWSLVLAGVATGLTYLGFGLLTGDWDFLWGGLQLAASAAFLGGLVVFPLYLHVRIGIEGVDHIANTALKMWVWSMVLMIWGGIAASLIFFLIFLLSDWSLAALGFGIIAFSIAAPFALVSGLITFTAYELSKRVRFVRKKQGEGYRLVRL